MEKPNYNVVLNNQHIGDALLDVVEDDSTIQSIFANANSTDYLAEILRLCYQRGQALAYIKDVINIRGAKEFELECHLENIR